MNQKTALITGINGQDGSYLAELLLKKGYNVHGMLRRTSQFARDRIEPIRSYKLNTNQVFKLHYGDLSDTSSLHFIIEEVRPSEIYNLASLSHVQISEGQPEYSTEINANAVLRLLEVAKHYVPKTRFYQASSSELFGKPNEHPQNEQTAFNPRSIYGIAKLYSYWVIKHYRDTYGLHASNGILYNHESPRRGENFVTRKITYSLAQIKAGLQDVLELGNLDAKRDWGHARDYVNAMWLMLQKDSPEDYVISTGKLHSVRDFVNEAAKYAGINIDWQGKGTDEVGINSHTGQLIIKVNPAFYRPVEKSILQGNPQKAINKLNWKAQISFSELIKEMMFADLKLFDCS